MPIAKSFTFLFVGNLDYHHLDKSIPFSSSIQSVYFTMVVLQFRNYGLNVHRLETLYFEVAFSGSFKEQFKPSLLGWGVSVLICTRNTSD